MNPEEEQTTSNEIVDEPIDHVEDFTLDSTSERSS